MSIIIHGVYESVLIHGHERVNKGKSNFSISKVPVSAYERVSAHGKFKTVSVSRAAHLRTEMYTAHCICNLCMSVLGSLPSCYPGFVRTEG